MPRRVVDLQLAGQLLSLRRPAGRIARGRRVDGEIIWRQHDALGMNVQPHSVVRQHMHACHPLPGRICVHLLHRRDSEQVGRRGNVLFVNDSKGTNADAAAHALSSFGDIFWIAGGKPKQGGITGLSEYFPRIRKAYLIGEAAQEFAETLGEHVPHEISETLDVAVASAARDAEASGLVDAIVLLSPACASFDQYRNFEIRGARFRDLVTAIPGVKPVV